MVRNTMALIPHSDVWFFSRETLDNRMTTSDAIYFFIVMTGTGAATGILITFFFHWPKWR